MLLQSSFTIRPRYSLVYIFFLFFAVLTLLIGTKTGYKDARLYYFFAGVTAFVVLWLIVLSRLKIYIDSSLIRMETIIRKEEILWKKIVSKLLSYSVREFLSSLLIAGRRATVLNRDTPKQSRV